MKPLDPAPPAGGSGDEVAGLIATLHATSRRLEELTAGEVDAVAGGDGRPFLLQHAQDRMRASEAVKQRRILDALPAHIALLDSRGTILSVNDAWREFGASNGLTTPDYAVGTNYLAICDDARGADCAGAAEVAAGIRSVLDAVPSFSMEYACHSKTEERWYLLSVTSLGEMPPRGAVVMHVDITERRSGEERSLRFAAAMDSVADAIYLVDRTSMELVHVNDAACRMQGMRREELIALGPGGLLKLPRAELERTYDAVIASGTAPPIEMLRPRPDGSQVWVELRRHAHLTDGRWMIVTLVRDITDRRRDSEALRASEDLKGAILEASLDCVITLDHEGTITEFNPTAQATFGLSRELALGRSMVDTIVPPRHRDAHRKGFAHYLATGAGPILGKRIEIEALRADGREFPIELTIAAIGGGDKPRFAGFIRDITARKETDRKVKRLNRVQAVLSGTNALLVRAPAHDDLLAEACRIAVGQGELRMAWIGLVDKPGGMLRPSAAAGEVGDFFTSAPREVTQSTPCGYGIAGRAVWEQRPMISNDVSNDPAIVLKKAFAERRINSLAAIPLVVGKQAIGALSIYSEDVGFFNAEEMRPLLEMAANISLAIEHIEKAERLARTTRVNAMLSDINGAIVRIRDRQALFDEACRIAVETGGLPFAWISMIDATEQRCKPMASAGTDHGYLELIRDRLSVADDAPAGYALSARAVRGNVAQAVNDIESDSSIKYRREFGERGIRAIAALPISIAGRAVGAFELYSTEAGFFDAEEMKVLEEMAANIAFALDHMEKEEKVRRLTRVQAVLSGINALIVRAGDREELLREATRIAVEHGRFSMTWIAMVDRASGALRPVASAGNVGDFFEDSLLAQPHNRPGGPGLAGRAVRELAPMISNDVARDPSMVRKTALLARGVRSAAHIPLVVGGVAIGVLALYSPDPGFFDAEEMELLEELGGHISRAIDHLDKHERLEYLAYYDALTGLPNRSLFLGRVAQGMLKAASGGHKLALLLIDLERFKNINDTLGRPAGDTLLKAVAQWVTRKAGDAQLVAHLGADHFAVVLPVVRREGSVVRLLETTMKEFLDHPFELSEGSYRIALKVGVALFPNDGTTADTLFEHAEAALKKAKASGDRVLFYKPSMTEVMAGKLTLENQLRRALDNGEFVLHYQPKVQLASGRLTGAEALIRWNDPRTGLVPPGRFIPVLEETGLIHDVGRWALRQAIEDYLRWRAAGLPAARVAVNVSPLQLRSRAFVSEIRGSIGAGAHAASGLELEITESLIMEDVKHSIATLQAVRAMGVTVAIDDFGTGFSSLSYLAKLPVDTVKIDRSFVNDMAVGPEGLALVSTIIGLAHSLRLNVVAEGVETPEQSRLLRLLDCDEMQGFLLSKAVPAEDFEARFLRTAPAAAA